MCMELSERLTPTQLYKSQTATSFNEDLDERLYQPTERSWIGDNG